MSEIKTEKNDTQSYNVVKLIPVLLKEAAIDSPSFRAVLVQSAENLDRIDQWVDEYIKTLNRMKHDIDNLQETTNLWLSRFIPDADVTENLIDGSYTIQSWGLLAESAREFWSQIVRAGISIDPSIVQPLANLQKGQLRRTKEFRKNLENAQLRYDSLLSRYLSQSKYKEPSALREDAFQVYESYKLYTGLSLDYCVSSAEIKMLFGQTLIQITQSVYAIRAKINNQDTKIFREPSRIVARIQAWMDAVSSTWKNLLTQLSATRKGFDDYIADAHPSRELSDYSVWTLPPSAIDNGVLASPLLNELDDVNLAEKSGWLNLKTTVGKPARQIWVRRWAFVKNGMFGLLVQSPNGKFVQESDKFGVLLCNVKPALQEDRRFCFEITTKDTTIGLQATTQQELIHWIHVFDVAKKWALENVSTDYSQLAFSIIPPILPEFAFSAQTSIDTELVHEAQGHIDAPTRASMDTSPRSRQQKNVSGGAQALQAILNASQSLTGYLSESIPDYLGGTEKIFIDQDESETIFAPTVLSKMPIYTAKTREAVIACGLFRRPQVPNAIDANIFGCLSDSELYAERSLDEMESESIINDYKKVKNNDLSVPPTSHHSHGSRTGNHQNSSTNIIKWNSELQDYPSYYPSELRIQDASLRALFGVKGDERAITAWRCMWNSNSTLDLPSMVFMTQKALYIYSNSLGFITLKKLPFNDLVGARGESGIAYDHIILMTKGGDAINARLFVESGRIIHRRIHIALQSFNDGKKLSLQQILNDFLHADEITLPTDGESAWKYDDGINATHGTSYGALSPKNEHDFKLDSKGKPHSSSINKTSHTDKKLIKNSNDSNSSILNNKLQKISSTLSSNSSKNDVSIASVSNDRKSSHGRKRDTNRNLKISHSEDSKFKYLGDVVYEASAKTLFHVLFGDKSPIFQNIYKDIGFNTRQTAWTSSEDYEAILQRFIKYDAIVEDINLNKKRTEIVTKQEVNLIDDHLKYIVTMYSTPWNLPFRGSFNIVTRFVISFVAKSRCRLEIWNKIQWVNTFYPPKLARYVVEDFIGRSVRTFTQFINNHVGYCIERLGHKNKTIKAIHLYGEVGKLAVPPTVLSKSVAVKDKDLPVFHVFKRTLIYYLFMIMYIWIRRVTSYLLAKGTRVVSFIYEHIRLHWLLIFLLSISIFMNVLLVGKSSINYWNEKWLERIYNERTLFSSTFLSKSIYLKDLSEYVHNNSLLADTIVSNNKLANYCNKNDKDCIEEYGKGIRDSDALLCYEGFKGAHLAAETGSVELAREGRIFIEPGKNSVVDLGVYLNGPNSSSSVLSCLTDSKSGWCSIARRIRASREKLGKRRHDFIVAIRVINELERELIEAEWRNFLANERFNCMIFNKNYGSLVKALEGSIEGGKINMNNLKTLSEQKFPVVLQALNDEKIKLGSDEDIEALLYLNKYCNSCMSDNLKVTSIY